MMNKTRLLRLTRALAAKEEGRPRLPATPEEERALFTNEKMQALVADAFGSDDPRASSESLETLSLPQLKALCMEAMAALKAKELPDPLPPHLAAFCALPVEERILTLYDQRRYRRFTARFFPS